jgi:serine/threonine protein kinase
VTLPLREIEGKYEILHKIKEGGMGAIYKVRHRLLDEIRVVKLIRPQLAQNAELQQRFRREAKTAIRLKHPNVAQLYDFALDEQGTAYIVMEFIDGVTLEELLAKGGPPTLGLGLEIAQQGLRALGYLHRQGYVHRDIASDNLMLTRRYDGTPLVKLIDLGIAKRLGVDGGLTQTGMFLGKVRYASPEQFAESGKVPQDHRSDLYSCGVLLYELLTGRFPFAGEAFNQIIAGHLFHPPMDFGEADPEGKVPDGVRKAILRALEKDPDRRFASADEFADLLVPFAAAKEELREDVDRTLATTTLLLPEEEALKPGSTQSHLDAQFAAGTTPQPKPLPDLRAVPAAPAAEAPAAAADPGRQKVEALLAHAQLMARLEQLDKAEHELQRLLELAPEHPEAGELLASVQLARRRQTETREHQRELMRRVRRVRQLLSEGEAEKAQEVFEGVAGEHGGAAELAPLRQEVEAAVAAAAGRRREVEEAAAQIDGLLAAGELGAAAEALAAAEGQLGADDAFAELAQRLAAASQGREEERRKSDAIAAAVGAIADLLGQGELEAAGRRIAETEESFGGFPALIALRQELAGLEKRGAARRPKSRPAQEPPAAGAPPGPAPPPAPAVPEPSGTGAGPVPPLARLAPSPPGPSGEVDLLANARRLVELGALEQARAILERLRQRQAGGEAAATLLVEVEQALKQRDQEPQKGAVADAARSIAREIAAGRLEVARAELQFALRRYGEVPELTGLRRRLEEAGGGAAPAPPEGASSMPAKAAASSPASPKAAAVSPPQPTAVVATRAVSTAAEPAPARRRPLWPWIAIAAAVVLAVVLILWLGRGGDQGAPPAAAGTSAAETAAAPQPQTGATAAAGATGFLVVDAPPPGARVEEVIDTAGLRHPPGDDPRTPLRLALPAGTYTLVVSRGEATRRLEVEVRADETTDAVVDFDHPAPPATPPAP